MRSTGCDTRTDEPDVEASGECDRERPRSAAGGPGRRVVVASSVPLVAALAVLTLCAGPVGAVAAPGGVGDVTDDATGTDWQQGTNPRICDRNASTFVSVFNRQTDSVPGIVRDRVRNSQVHLRVAGTAGGSYTMVTDEQTRVVSYSEGRPASPSIRVETDCETFRAITDAGNPGNRFRTAYANDEVRFVGLTLVDRVLFTGIELLSDPVSLAVVLLVFLLLVVGGYVLYRRLSIHYRGGDPAVDPEE